MKTANIKSRKELETRLREGERFRHVDRITRIEALYPPESYTLEEIEELIFEEIDWYECSKQDMVLGNFAETVTGCITPIIRLSLHPRK